MISRVYPLSYVCVPVRDLGRSSWFPRTSRTGTGTGTRTTQNLAAHTRTSTPPREVMRGCREILERNSKSFALAARFLSPEARDRAAAVYAWCRRVDDAIDEAPPSVQASALEKLKQELRLCYQGHDFEEPALRAFQAVARSSGLPERYPQELIEGMSMDVLGFRYERLDDLLLYCHRVASVVGLMMCHVFGITRDDALEQAAHLGIAMQLTNICRDVQEDWGLGRLYLPREMLSQAGAHPIPHPIRGRFPSDPALVTAMERVMLKLLSEADRYYRSADHGLAALPFSAGLAVRVARTLYHAIGTEILARDCDLTQGRAVVPVARKGILCLSAAGTHLLNLSAFAHERLGHGRWPRPPQTELDGPAILARRNRQTRG